MARLICSRVRAGASVRSISTHSLNSLQLSGTSSWTTSSSTLPPCSLRNRMPLLSVFCTGGQVCLLDVHYKSCTDCRRRIRRKLPRVPAQYGLAETALQTRRPALLSHCTLDPRLWLQSIATARPRLWLDRLGEAHELARSRSRLSTRLCSSSEVIRARGSLHTTHLVSLTGRRYWQRDCAGDGISKRFLQRCALGSASRFDHD